MAAETECFYKLTEDQHSRILFAIEQQLETARCYGPRFDDCTNCPHETLCNRSDLNDAFNDLTRCEKVCV